MFLLGGIKISARLTLGFLVMALMLAGVSIFSLKELNKAQEPLVKEIPAGLQEIDRTSHLDGLAQKIRYYDQILTESAKNYATTGLVKWKYKYSGAEPLLDQAIREAIQKGDAEDQATFSSAGRAKQVFGAMETQSMQVMDSGNQAQAIAILENPSYWQLKEEYKDALEKYVERRGKKVGESLEVTTSKVNQIVLTAHDRVEQSIRFLAAASLGGFLFALMFAYWIAQSIIVPIHRLKKGVEVIGKGNLNYKISVESKDEIGAFAAAFREMTQKLKESYMGLEEKVKEKTAELASNMKEIEHQNKELEKTKKEILEVLDDLENAKTKVEKEKAQSDALLASIGDGMIAIDFEGKIIRMNVQASQMLGVPVESFLGRSIFEAIQEADEKGKKIPFQNRAISMALETGKKMSSIVYYPRQDGSRFPAALSVSPVVLDGKIMGAIEIVRDVTREKEVDRMKTEFISTVSHELRTPLTVIREGVSLVLDGMMGEINEKQKKFLNVSLSDIDRLKRIIDNLLDIAKIEAGKVELKREPIDLKELMKGVEDIFQARAAQKNLKLILDLPEQDLDLCADRDKIIQVFTNLIGNALKFTEKGAIILSASVQKNEILCAVSDTGKGISQDDLPSVFGKFQQFGRENGSGEKGTGLGLSIAKAVTELHGGKIWVESEVNKGTKFLFTLPILHALDLFKENLMGILKEAKIHYQPVSVAVCHVTVSSFEESHREELLKKTMPKLESLAKASLRRQIDLVVRDRSCLYIGLPGTDKKQAEVVIGRIEELCKNALELEKLQGSVGVFSKVTAFPDDGTTEIELIEQAA